MMNQIWMNYEWVTSYTSYLSSLTFDISFGNLARLDNECLARKFISFGSSLSVYFFLVSFSTTLFSQCFHFCQLKNLKSYSYKKAVDLDWVQYFPWIHLRRHKWTANDLLQLGNFTKMTSRCKNLAGRLFLPIRISMM
jgi:hypothetical protein